MTTACDTSRFPKLEDPSRTIHTGRASSVYGPICEALNIGEYHAPNYNTAKTKHLKAGWFVSPAEMELIKAEVARRQKVAKARHVEQNRLRDLRVKAEKKPVDRYELALETWRNECRRPAPRRKDDPVACWKYACRAHGLPASAPMPAETPPLPVSHEQLVTEAALRRVDDGNSAQIVKPARMGDKRG